MTEIARRQSGLAIPLFACPSSRSWGVGDIGDLQPLTRWLSGAGQRVLQLLPINEMAPGQQSPYSAISAMAIDPIYLSVPDVPGTVETARDVGRADRPSFHAVAFTHLVGSHRDHGRCHRQSIR